MSKPNKPFAHATMILMLLSILKKLEYRRYHHSGQRPSPDRRPGGPKCLAIRGVARWHQSAEKGCLESSRVVLIGLEGKVREFVKETKGVRFQVSAIYL